MNSPPCTTVAGRHAADTARRAEALAKQRRIDLSHADAREALRAAIAHRGLRVFEKLSDDDPSLFVRCSIENCWNDQRVVNAVVDELGWTPDTLRLSRFQDHYENVRLYQAATGARVLLTVSRPGALQNHGQAA